MNNYSTLTLAAPVRAVGASLVLIGLVLCGPLDARSYAGKAYDLETGELLYEERHRESVSAAGPTLNTQYVSPDGELIARREVTFGDRPLAPSFEFHDQRINYREGAAWVGDEVEIYRSQAGERKASRIEPGRRPLVIDAGFDQLVRQRWDELMAGETVRFDFANPDRLDTIGFELELIETRTVADDAVQVFEMRLSNGLISWLVETIEVAYRASDRSLYEYVGVSNIKSPAGDNYRVRIEFPPSSSTTSVAVSAE